MTDEPAEGGCLCGAVRYRVSGEPVAATLCHCRSCRRASGGVNVAWAVFDKGDVRMAQGRARANIAPRPASTGGICADCGSLVGYRRDSRPDHIDITTAHPRRARPFPPTVEIWIGDKIAWEALHPDLPKKLATASLNE